MLVTSMTGNSHRIPLFAVYDYSDVAFLAQRPPQGIFAPHKERVTEVIQARLSCLAIRP